MAARGEWRSTRKVCVSGVHSTLLGVDVLKILQEAGGTLHIWSTIENRPFILLEFTRTPEQFHQCLAIEPTLVTCRQRLEAAGHSTELDSWAKVFLHPEHWLPVLDYFEKCVHHPCRLSDLRSRHVVTDERHCKAVLSATDGLKKKFQVKIKSKTFFRVDVPITPAWVSILPELSWETMLSPPPDAWETMELDLQSGSPAKIRWRHN